MSTAESVKNQTWEIISSMPHLIAIKFPVAIMLGAAEWVFGGQNFERLAILVALVTFDLITAIIAEFKNGSPIESRKALKTATKLLVYGVMVAGTHLASEAMGVTFMDGAAISFLAVTELISILENIGKSGYVIPKKLLNKLNDIRSEA